MLPKWHIFYGFILSAILYSAGIIGINEAIILFIASFMIDIDHYLYYLIKKRKINPIKAVRWFYERRRKALLSKKKVNDATEKPLYLLHWWVITVLLYLAGLYAKPLVYVALGFSLHLILDVIEIRRHNNLNYAKFFFIKAILANRNKKKIILL